MSRFRCCGCLKCCKGKGEVDKYNLDLIDREKKVEDNNQKQQSKITIKNNMAKQQSSQHSIQRSIQQSKRHSKQKTRTTIKNNMAKQQFISRKHCKQQSKQKQKQFCSR